MKIVRWLLGMIVAVIVVLFALSNRQAVVVGFWPLDDGIGLPVYLVALVPLLGGFLAGSVLTGVRGFKYRRIARRQSRRVAQLERQLAEAKPPIATVDLALPPPQTGDRS